MLVSVVTSDGGSEATGAQGNICSQNLALVDPLYPFLGLCLPWRHPQMLHWIPASKKTMLVVVTSRSLRCPCHQRLALSSSSRPNWIFAQADHQNWFETQMITDISGDFLNTDAFYLLLLFEYMWVQDIEVKSATFRNVMGECLKDWGVFKDKVDPSFTICAAPSQKQCHSIYKLPVPATDLSAETYAATGGLALT